MNSGLYGVAGATRDPRRKAAEVARLPFPALFSGLLVGNAGLLSPSSPASHVQATADLLVLDDGAGDFRVLRDFSATAATSAVGAGGLDTGSVASTTWYAVWAIWDDVRRLSALLLSTSFTAPLLPAGYRFSRRLGAVRTDGSNNLYRTLQAGTRAQYVIGTLPTAPLIMAQTVTAVSWATAIAVGAYVPPSAPVIHGIVESDSFSASNAVLLAPNGDYAAADTALRLLGGTPLRAQFSFVLESTNIYWGTSDDGQVWCTGWEDAL